MELKNLPGAWVLEAFRRGGVDLDELAQRLPDETNQMLYEIHSISPDSVNRLFEVCVELSGDQDFGLTMNEHIDISMYGLLGYLLLNSSTVRDLFETLVRYHSVHHHNGIYYKLITRKKTVSIRMCFDYPEHTTHRHTTEWGLGFTPHFLKDSLAEFAQPLNAQFSYDAPTDLDRLHAAFGPKLEFNQAHSQLTYPRSILDRRITDVNPGMLTILRQQADNYLLKLNENNSLQKQIEVVLYEHLSTNRTNASDVAKILNLSLSTFKRKLSKEDIDFKKTKDNVKNRLAKQLLTHSNALINEIAFKTGFTNPSSFTRFFIRCNAVKPLEYRKKFAGQER